MMEYRFRFKNIVSIQRLGPGGLGHLRCKLRLPGQCIAQKQYRVWVCRFRL